MDAIAAGMRCARHRGPDEAGTWHDDDVVFGFNRLSIIDIEHSHQPLRWGPPESPDRYALVFNGEIYNYLELRERAGAPSTARSSAPRATARRSSPPTTTGARTAVARLRGMFAFLIWDTQDRVLFGARDPFGIKPLFVAQTPDGVGVLLRGEGPARADRPGQRERACAAALPGAAVRSGAGDHGSRRSARSSPGTHVTVRPGRPMKTKRYFHPVFAGRPAISDAERSALYQRIAAVMDDSVAKHMRADVTVGAFLSGGIDSTAIAALAKRYNPDLMTFTTGFEREGFSEVDVAAESAAAIGVRHVIRTVSETGTDRDAAADHLVPGRPGRRPGAGAAVLRGQRGPQARQGGAVRRGRRRAVRRVQHLPRADAACASITGLPDGMRKGLAAVGRALPQGFRGQDMLRRGSLDLEDRYYGNARIFREEQLAGLLRTYDPARSFRDITDPIYAQTHGDRPDRPDAARRPVHLAARRHPGQGRQDDDGELAGAAGAVPGHRGVRGGQDHPGRSEGHQADHQAGAAQGDGADRAAARAAPAQARLPGADPAFPGRATPTSGPADIITTAHTDEYLDPAAVLAMLDAHRAGEADHSRRIWTILVFQLWHEIFVTGAVTPVVPEPAYPVRL